MVVEEDTAEDKHCAEERGRRPFRGDHLSFGGALVDSRVGGGGR